MNTARALLFGLTLAATMAAHAQYQWVDKDGRRVFSDRPPPADVPQKNVLQQPRMSTGAPVARAAPAPAAAPTAAASEAPSAAASPAAAASAPPAVDKTLEEKKKQAEAAEAAKRKAEEEKIAAARAESCKRAMNAKASLESGMRMARLNDKGEREVLDDNQRAAEMKRTQQIIDQDCR